MKICREVSPTYSHVRVVVTYVQGKIEVGVIVIKIHKLIPIRQTPLYYKVTSNLNTKGLIIATTRKKEFIKDRRTYTKKLFADE